MIALKVKFIILLKKIKDFGEQKLPLGGQKRPREFDNC